MLASLALAAVVLTAGEAVFVDTSAPGIVRSVPLGGEGMTAFGTPDGRVLVPLVEADATAVVSGTGSVERWDGRIFPLFFDEPDRMYTILPGALVLLSYPERVPLRRFPLAGLAGAWRAACSSNGQLVAIVPPPPANRGVIVAALFHGSAPGVTALSGEARDLAMAPGGEWIAVGLGSGGVEVVLSGESSGRGRRGVPGEVSGLAVGPDPRDLLVAVAAGEQGSLLCFRVSDRAEQGLRQRFATPLSAAPLAVAVAGEDVLVLHVGGLDILEKKGRRMARRVAIPGARGLVVLAERVASALPDWSDKQPPGGWKP